MEDMEDSIFTKIVKGEIPSHKVYEDALTMAFLDIHPVQPGMTVVIPRKQVEFIWDLPEEDYLAVMSTVYKVAQRIREVLGVHYVGEVIEGVEIPHAHVKLIPFDTITEFNTTPNVTAEPDHDSLAEIAKKLNF